MNYVGTGYELNGCINDVSNIKVYLKTRGYDVVTLIEEQATRTNILSGMTALIHKAISGDILFFHYSGHGSLLLDYNREEITGFDSTIIPYDFAMSGQIRDDDIYQYLVNPLPRGAKLFGILDSCFSGSAFDLRYQIIDQSEPINFTTPWRYTIGALDTALLFKEYKQYAKTNAEVYMLSGSMDRQTSSEGVANGIYVGALTYSFLEIVNSFNKNQMKWKHLLYNTRGYLKQAGFDQVPQLSSGQAPSLESLVWF
jgi:hypothetical protein